MHPKSNVLFLGHCVKSPRSGVLDQPEWAPGRRCFKCQNQTLETL